jgi:hypothetical protein
MPKSVIDSMRAAGVAEKEKEVLNNERRETKKAAKKSEEEL